MFETLFTAWGYSVTVLEAWAFGLALACVVLEVLEVHWSWPLAILSSLLYGRLFYEFRLYGDAALQVLFAVLALWGWWQWLFGRRRSPEAGAQTVGPIRIARLGRRGGFGVLLAWSAGWVALGLFLRRFTDTDVPWFDAFPTAGSVIGQVLLGRKFLETWHVWIGVNLVGIALFAYKALWLTAILYAVFAALSFVGLARWRRALAGAPR